MGKILYRPSEERIKRSNMYRFILSVNETFATDFREYRELYDWSVSHIEPFWEHFFRFAEIRCSAPYTEVVDDLTRMPGAKWFSGARLNFAENLLRHRDDQVALLFKGEGRALESLTCRALYRAVAGVARALKSAGVVEGDRVVGFMPNMPETVIAMLAAVSLGAVWSSCSPDFGIKGILDRFSQIAPKVLFAADGYRFKGKVFDCLEKVSSIVSSLATLEQVVITPYVSDSPDLSGIPGAVCFDQFKVDEADEVAFEQLPFSHPLYIMFTSGTTGLPKCMVQSAGGVLLHQLKELLLHTDLKREDVIFYFTTCGWMMWNWLVSALATGARVVLFDGNPFYPGPGALWQLAEESGITVFGTSAGYIQALMRADAKPGRDFDLGAIRTVLSTGSPLPEQGFEYIYREVKSDLQLSSISGGSDINGCFALGNPMLPVHSGELQCRGLAMSVHAFDESGTPVTDQKGELVCTAPFPSMPLYFWNDPTGERYREAYFDVYPGVWRHGDFVEVKSDTGGVVIYGRSDATLNPGGVRIGTSEIYREVETIDEIADSLVVGQRLENDERVVLFVKMREGVPLTDALKATIRDRIRKNASPRHVPQKIIPIADIPYTINLKKVELAVRNIIEGRPVRNRDALANPEALDLYRDIDALDAGPPR